MKRRNFLKNLGAGASTVIVGSQLKGAALNSQDNKGFDYSYGEVGSLSDVLTADDQVIIRLEFSYVGKERSGKSSGRISVKGAKINRVKEYFFEEEDDDFQGEKLAYDIVLKTANVDVIVLYLDNPTEKSSVTVNEDDGELIFSLKELIESKEAIVEIGDNVIKANFLLDKEIGEVKPEDFGAKDPGDNYMFTAMADPQGGDAEDPEKLRTRMRIHNAFIEESVALVNKLEETPAFNVVIGDVCDDWGYEKDLKMMNHFLGKLKCPVIYGIGNHETNLRSKFGPGYNMSPFDNYIGAQKEISGLDKLLYSFNMGQWHYVIWPDPLRPDFWENHPHYFDWLERDLEKYKDKPVMLFQHVPVHPIGITPHINYAESVFVKKTFLDILSKNGNVKYVLSGHVHIPVKAAFKTAVTYKGIKLINIPAAGYRERSFGEEDFNGGPAQGAAIIEVKGKEAVIKYKTVTEEQYTFPDKIPEFDDETYALWLRYKWQLPAAANILNGNFNSGTANWAKRYCYTEDENPSNLCEVRQVKSEAGSNALYLYSRCRGYKTPGQDRWPQDSNRIIQAVKLQLGKDPIVRFNYMLDGENCDFNGYCGSYVWVEGYCGSVKKMGIVYSAHKIWVNIGGKFADIKDVWNTHYALDESVDNWHKVEANIKDDFELKSDGIKFADMKLDRLIITIGTWNLNDGPEQAFAMYINGVNVNYDTVKASNIDGEEIQIKPKKDEWWRGLIWKNTNIAGEHRYVIATDWKID